MLCQFEGVTVVLCGPDCVPIDYPLIFVYIPEKTNKQLHIVTKAESSVG